MCTDLLGIISFECRQKTAKYGRGNSQYTFHVTTLREHRAEQDFFTLREHRAEQDFFTLRERRAEQDFFTLREREESSRDSLRRVPIT